MDLNTLYNLFTCDDCEKEFHNLIDFYHHKRNHFRLYSKHSSNFIENNMNLKEYKKAVEKHNNHESQRIKLKALVKRNRKPKRTVNRSNYDNLALDTTFRCNSCFKIFEDEGEMKYHISNYVHKDLYKCKCEQMFKTRVELAYHMYTEIHEDLFKCKICLRQFRGDKYAIHLKQEHNLNQYPYVCEICKERFQYLHQIRIHSNVCGLNDKSLKGKNYELNLPLSYRKNKLAYNCNMCQESFQSFTKFIIHWNLHTITNIIIDLNYSSQIESYKNKTSQNRAKKKRNRKKSDPKFNCQYCEEKFTTLMDMKRHIIYDCKKK